MWYYTNAHVWNSKGTLPFLSVTVILDAPSIHLLFVQIGGVKKIYMQLTLRTGSPKRAVKLRRREECIWRGLVFVFWEANRASVRPSRRI